MTAVTLEEATLDEIVEEIKKRSDGYMVLVAMSPKVGGTPGRLHTYTSLDKTFAVKMAASAIYDLAGKLNPPE